MNSHIERLFAKNSRGFSEINIEFGKSFNFIAGPNGCGKTSILTLISHCFHQASLESSRLSHASEFWVDISRNDEKLRLGMGETGIKSEDYRKAEIREWRAPPREPNRTSISLVQGMATINEAVPLFIGAYRKFTYKQIPGMKREPEDSNRMERFYSGATRSLYGENENNIKQWLINRYFIIEKDWAHEEKENWEVLMSCLPRIAPAGSDFRFVRIGKDLEPKFSIYGDECFLEELSAGFQAILFIIASIFDWIESRPEGLRTVANANGIVLIDELDIHLHPEWQFTLRDGLGEIFPNLQFIVTTHSPHLLASARPGEVIAVKASQRGRKLYLKPSPHSYSGWSTDQILSDLMGVRSLENKEYEKLISQALGQIEEKSVEGVEAAISSLENICHPDEIIVTVLKAKLAAMIAKND